MKAFERAARARGRKDDEWHKNHAQMVAWDTGEAMFDWWMEEKRQKTDSDQTIMFE